MSRNLAVDRLFAQELLGFGRRVLEQGVVLLRQRVQRALGSRLARLGARSKRLGRVRQLDLLHHQLLRFLLLQPQRELRAAVLGRLVAVGLPRRQPLEVDRRRRGRGGGRRGGPLRRRAEHAAVMRSTPAMACLECLLLRDDRRRLVLSAHSRRALPAFPARRGVPSLLLDVGSVVTCSVAKNDL
eukprot:COSAG04_NODE_713_length_10870_cov_3.260050_17_plen_185_part_00